MTPPTEWAGLPEGGPATLDAVKVLLGITDDVDDDVVGSKVAAANSIVRCLFISQLAMDAEAWPARITEGANMLAARWVRRRNSPAGVEAMGEFGAAYVMRSDPDIAQLLQLGTWAPPGVG